MQWANEKRRTTRDEKLKIKWTRITAYIAQTITHIAKEYDAPKIDARLDELERLFLELKAKKD